VFIEDRVTKHRHTQIKRTQDACKTPHGRKPVAVSRMSE